MTYKIERVDVWVGTMEDKPGGLAGILGPLADAGVNLEFVIARRAAENPGTSVAFMTPIKGNRQNRMAKKLGLKRATTLCSLRMEGPNKAGLAGRVTRAIANAGINLRGMSAAAIGRKCIFHFSFDKRPDATRAAKVLKQTVNG